MNLKGVITVIICVFTRSSRSCLVFLKPLEGNELPSGPQIEKEKEENLIYIYIRVIY